MHRQHFWAGALVLALLSPAAAQQPAGPVAAPTLPPIAPDQARLDQTINGLDGPGLAVAYNEDSGMIAAACEHGTIQCWYKDVMMGVRVGEGAPSVLHGHPGPVTALAWSGGPVLASAGGDGKVLLWEMPSGKLLQTLVAPARVRALAMSPDGKVLASAGDDAAVQLWDTATAKPTTKLTGHGDWVLALAFSADGKTLASGGYDGMVRLWDVSAGKKLLEVPATPPAAPNTPPPEANVVLALAFAPDVGRGGVTPPLLAVGGSDAQVYLVGTTDGKLVRSLPGHTSAVTALAFHAGGTLLVSGSKDRTVRLWNPANGQPVKALEGHTAWVEGVVFLARGTRLASVGADRTVKLWDLTPPKK